LACGVDVARSSLPNVDFAEVAEVSHVVDAHSRGAMLDTPNHNGELLGATVVRRAGFLNTDLDVAVSNITSSGAKSA